MRRGRIFIFLALIIIVGMVIAFFLLNGQPGVGGGAEPTPTVDMVNIITAGQNIPQGEQITEDMLGTMPVPRDQRLETTFTDDRLGEIVGQYARYPLDQGLPITDSMISSTRDELAGQGPPWARLIPPNKVAIAVPSNQLASVAYGVADGARVNIIACLLIVDVDASFQTALPNWTRTLIGTGTLKDSLPVWTMANDEPTGPQGRLELEPSIQQLFYVVPNEAQRPRLTCQMIVRDVLVLHLGNFPLDTEEWGQAATPNGTPDPNADQQQPAPTTEIPNIVTLVVDPQDAVSLNYLIYSGAELNLTLRGTGDQSLMETEAIALHNLLSQYNIPVPVKLPYATNPPVYELIPPIDLFVTPQ